MNVKMNAMYKCSFCKKALALQDLYLHACYSVWDKKKQKRRNVDSWKCASCYKEQINYKELSCEDCGNVLDVKEYDNFLGNKRKLCHECQEKRAELAREKRKEELETILKRGNEQARILYKESKNKCLLTCQPTKLLIYYACDYLSLSNDVFEKAFDLLYTLSKKTCWIGSRYTLAASLLYVVGIMEGERRTQREIAREFQITEVAVRTAYRKIKNILQIIVPV